MAETAEPTIGQIFLDLLKAIFKKLIELLTRAAAAAGEYAKNKAASMDSSSGTN